jgi:hypothetical protein
MSYLNSVTIIGFVGADPEQRQARNNNGSKFTVLSVATQRSWKNTDDEWASKTEWHRVCVWNLSSSQTTNAPFLNLHLMSIGFRATSNRGGRCRTRTSRISTGSCETSA